MSSADGRVGVGGRRSTPKLLQLRDKPSGWPRRTAKPSSSAPRPLPHRPRRL